jgi:hypothetical protein
MNLRESKRMEEEPSPDCGKEKRIRLLEYYVVRKTFRVVCLHSVRRQLLRNTDLCFMFYWLSNANQTDQADETEGLGEGWIREGDIGEIDIGEGGVKGLYIV